MKKVFLDLIQHVPDYKEFLTVEELDNNSKKLAEKYPDVVSLSIIGKTKDGLDIPCLKIGNGSKNALMFGCPHPNEPIGTMMLEYFSEELAKNKELRDELDYTWYIVKAWDADGLKKNERWLKGPFNIHNYSRYFFRPAGHQQVDWTFPIKYKELDFNRPIPETQAMMKLIDEIKPHFIYSLHNAGFGGVYWYISQDIKPVYEDMYAAADRVKVPLNLGEPEAPWCVELAPAIYQSLGIKDDYDYLEKYGEKNIGEILNVGDCSASYAVKRHGSFTLLTELPYFFNEKIMNNNPGTMTRKECTIKGLDNSIEKDKFVKGYLEQLKDVVDPKNQFRLALEAFTEGRSYESTRKMAETNPEYARTATVAEEFQLLVSRFYNMLSLGMIIGMCEYELEHSANGKDPEKASILKAVIKEVERIHQTESENLEKELKYEVIPIRKLVSIQLECGLLVSHYLKDKPPIEG